MRLILVTGVFALSHVACAADPEAMDPGTILRANANAGTVGCSADEGGNLHVRAPADAQVTTPADSGDDATVEVAYAPIPIDEAGQMPRPIRPASRSLGFIGDAPLNQGPNHGGRWSYGAHDNLLPPHSHSTGFAGSSGYRSSYRYGSSGYGGYAFPPPRRW